MSDTYTGLGNSQEDALGNLKETAQKNGLKGDPSDLAYTCKLTRDEQEYEGEPNADYGLAVASLLERAGVKSSDIEEGELEVQVTGVYKAADKNKPRPAGAAPHTKSTTLTDLM